MPKRKKRFRLTMLGLLCGGLLLVGIGVGVAFAEYSAFTYAGQRVPEQAREQSQSFTAEVDPEAPWIAIYGRGAGLEQLGKAARIEVSEDLAPGTVRIDLQYRSVGSQIHASWNDAPLGNSIRLYYWNSGGDVDMLMAYKDQILEDIRNHQLGDYVAVQLTEAVITVNPADAEKIVWD